jgi:hypothetical protein
MRLAKTIQTSHTEAEAIKLELVYGLSKTIFFGLFLYEEGNFKWSFQSWLEISLILFLFMFHIN